MMKRLRLLATLAWLVCCSAYAVPARQMTGGYSSAKASDPSVVAAARFAVRERARQQGKRLRLVAVKSAEQQVVAGMNYRLCLRVREGRSTSEAQAVVYRDLQNNLSLTEYTPAGCAK